MPIPPPSAVNCPVTISIMVYKQAILKILKFLGVLLFWLLIWKAASLLVGDSLQIFLPGPERVLAKWVTLVGDAEFGAAVWRTLLRIFEGFAWGVLCGALLGVLTAYSRVCYALLSPLMKMIRAVPVVSFIILVFVFLHVDRIPVFICLLMVMPTVWQSMHDGLLGTDKKLLELGKVYAVGKGKELLLIRLPSAMPGLITTCVNALGLGWKAGVAAEVISAPDLSLGFQMQQAKSSLEYDQLFAITLTVVLLSLIFEVLLRLLCDRLMGKEAAG